MGVLAHFGDTISDQTVNNLLKRHGLPPAPERKTTTTWEECISTSMDVLPIPLLITPMAKGGKSMRLWEKRGLV